jgi:hypothetical protein
MRDVKRTVPWRETNEKEKRKKERVEWALGKEQRKKGKMGRKKPQI